MIGFGYAWFCNIYIEMYRYMHMVVILLCLCRTIITFCLYFFCFMLFFLLSYDFPYCVHIVHTQVVCQIDICSLKTIIDQLKIITFCVYFFYFMLHPLKTFFNVCFRLRCVMPSCPTFREYVDLINVFKWVI